VTKEQALFRTWLEELKNEPSHQAHLLHIQGDEEEIKDRFYRTLEFGTAGLRGVLGLGTNRMNVFTVGQATQGLADYLAAHCEKPAAAIAYDSRINSDVFAQETARVFAANGVKVYLYKELMPTPALSYAVREYHCDTGVVITASHNPAKYNGYKAYDDTGCQIGPEVADEVMANIEKTDIFTGVKRVDFDEALADGRIEYIPDSFVEQYINRVSQEGFNVEACAAANLKLVYTPLNGAGNKPVRAILAKAGVKNITVVPEQENPDGNFPTCPYPNPEMKEALQLGLDLCQKTDSDMLLATDPDADRVAVAVKDGGEFRILTGNEVGVLLLDYICTVRHLRGKMPKNPVAVKSIVSSKLADAVAKNHHVEMVNVLTGFKFIGEVIHGLEEKGELDRFIFGFEESCGYLSGGYVRDKDAVDASLLLVEMASVYKLAGQTLLDALHNIYKHHGIYRNAVESFAFEGADGMDKMAAIMNGLREAPPAEIGGDKIAYIEDIGRSVRIENGVESPIALPKSNVLEYGLSTGCTVIVRPSGTEPKIKIYYSLVAKSDAEVDALEERYKQACHGLVAGE
jgi:phosphoglucomutase